MATVRAPERSAISTWTAPTFSSRRAFSDSGVTPEDALMVGGCRETGEEGGSGNGCRAADQIMQRAGKAGLAPLTCPPSRRRARCAPGSDRPYRYPLHVLERRHHRTARASLMFAATARRSFNMAATVTSAPFSRAVVNAMRKLYVRKISPACASC